MAEASERIREFLLVVVEQSGVRDDDEGLAEAKDVYDGAGAWGRGEGWRESGGGEKREGAGKLANLPAWLMIKLARS